MKKEHKIILVLLIITILFLAYIIAKPSYAVDNNTSIEEEKKLQRDAVVEVAKAYLRKSNNIQYDTNRRWFNFAPEEATKDKTVFSVCSVFVQAVYTEALGINVPNYTQFLHDYAENPENSEFVVMYYSETDYINKTNTSEKRQAIFNEILKKAKPGDILTNKGHTMLFVDVSANDAVVIESVGTSGEGKYRENGSIRKMTLKELAEQESSPIYKKGQFSIIRPIANGKTFREKSGKVTNYKITDSSLTRLMYPDMDIEKLGSKNTRSYVNFNDKITYNIKITNNSDKTYTGLTVVEKINDELVSIADSGGGIYSNGKLTWSNITINPGKSLNIKYIVKVKNIPSNYKKVIESTGYVEAYKNGKYVGKIKNAEIVNTIGYTLNDVDSKKLIDTVNSIKNSSSKQGLDFIEEVYNKAFGIKLELLKKDFITNIELGTLNDKLKNYVFLDLYNSYSNAHWFRTSTEYRDGTPRKKSAPFDVIEWNSNYDKYIRNINHNSLKVGDLVLYSLNNNEVIYLCMGESKFLEITSDSKKIIDDPKTIIKLFYDIFYKDYFVTLSPSLLMQNNLASIKVNGNVLPEFNSDNLKYTLNVSSDVDSVKIDATLVDSNVSKLFGDIGTKKITTGSNHFQIETINSVGTSKIYALDIIKASPGKSSNNYLEKLNLDVRDIRFDKNNHKYNVTVSYEINKVSITALAEDNKANVVISGNKELSVGENVFVIKVTAEDLSTREYKIIIFRNDKNVKLSNNSKLSSLNINGYKIKFDKERTNYILFIKNEDKLNITYVKEDNKSNVEISGNENLKNGSVIKINVTAEDGSTTDYKINIKKSESNNTSKGKTYMYLSVTLGTILFLCLIIYCKRKK